MVTGGACGGDAPDGPHVSLRITRDFGHRLLGEDRLPLREHGTPLRLLRAKHDVRLDRHGEIDSIDGLRDSFGSPSRERSAQTTWAVEVNGIEIDVGVDELPLAPGDVVQVDLGNLYGSYDSRATVGAFPQPFTGGITGYRPRVTVECAAGYRRACHEVRSSLEVAGVDISGRAPPQRPADARTRRARAFQPVIRRARILVGPWSRWRRRPWPRRVDRGPESGGVFVRFAEQARTVDLLDWHSVPARRLGPGTGVIAAMCPAEPDILWLVTGVDRLGVERAARALDPSRLLDAFGVATTATGGVIKLPLAPRTPR